MCHCLYCMWLYTQKHLELKFLIQKDQVLQNSEFKSKIEKNYVNVYPDIIYTTYTVY